jgi:hypothetical protein
MAENTDIVRLRLELEDVLSSKFKKATEDIKKSLSDTKQKVSENKSAFSGLADEWRGGFSSALSGAVKGFIGFQVVSKTTQFLMDARREYKDAAQGLLQLKTALNGSTVALEEQAKALSKKLVIDDDDIISMQAQLAMYIKNGDQIKKLTPAVIDLAKAKGMNLSQAAGLVARGIADDSEELGRLKISVEGAKGSMERIDSVVRGLTANFGGQAEAIAATTDAIDRGGLSWKNFSEQIGEVMHQVFGGRVSKEVTPLGRATQDLEIYTKQLVKAQEQAKKQDPTGSMFFPEVNALQVKVQETQKIVDEFNAKKAASDKAYNDKIASDAKASAIKAEEEISKERKSIQDKARDEHVRAQTEQIETTSRIASANVDLYMEGYDAQLANEAIFYDKELQLAKLNKQNLEVVTIEHNARMKQIQDEEALKVKDYEEKKQKERDEYTKNLQTIQITMQNELDASSKQSFDAWVKQEKEKAKIASDNRRNEVANGISSAGQLFSAIADSNKRTANEKKNIARVEAGINTAVAVTKALPDPFAVAFALAMGIAQQVAISNAKFATGTPYASGGTALVGERGQELIDLPRGATVRNNYETRNSYGGNTVVLNVTDNSGNLIDTFTRQIKRGDADSMVQELLARAGAM